MLDDRVSPVNRLRVHFDPILRKISQPSLWNASACVSRKFHKAVVLACTVSDFYYQQNIGRPSQRARVEIIAPAQKGQIRWGLRVVVKLNRRWTRQKYPTVHAARED